MHTAEPRRRTGRRGTEGKGGGKRRDDEEEEEEAEGDEGSGREALARCRGEESMTHSSIGIFGTYFG